MNDEIAKVSEEYFSDEIEDSFEQDLILDSQFQPEGEANLYCKYMLFKMVNFIETFENKRILSMQTVILFNFNRYFAGLAKR